MISAVISMDPGDEFNEPGRCDTAVGKKEEEENGMELEVGGSEVYEEMLDGWRSSATGGLAISLPLIASSDETGTSKSLRASAHL